MGAILLNKRGRPFKVQPEEVARWTEKYKNDVPYRDYRLREIALANEMIKEGIIDESSEYAIFLLYCSFNSRINATHYKTGIYDGVYCEWSDPIQACYDVIENLPSFWDKWRKVTENYQQTGIHGDRPSIDRLSEEKSIGYRKGNIGCLSLSDNTARATKKPHYVFFLNNNYTYTNNEFKKYESKKAALDDLQISFKTDTGRLYEKDGRKILVQSERVSLGLQRLDEHEHDEQLEEYRGWLPVQDVLCSDGVIRTAYQAFTFPMMAIVLKPMGGNQVE